MNEPRAIPNLEAVDDLMAIEAFLHQLEAKLDRLIVACYAVKHFDRKDMAVTD